MQITADQRPVLDWIDANIDETINLLETIVNIDSGTYDKTGVDAVAVALGTYLVLHGVHCDIIPLESFGNVLKAKVGCGNGRQPILLMGHRDTVFARGEAERRPFQILGNRAYGPGVADMKAGLVMNATILAAFQAIGAPTPLAALFTGDEEIGSRHSRPIIECEARKARFVFNSEPGRVNGNVVTGRKGGVFFRCQVEGKSAHSGVNFADGASAIEEMARKVVDWHRLTDLPAGTTVNVGLLNGGQSVNSVAPSCSCEIDLRYVRPTEREGLVQAISAIAAKCSVTGTKGKISITGEFLPLVETSAARSILECYVGSARSIGVSTAGEFTGSSADSGFTAAVGIPTLCGVGPVGGKAHTPEEYIEVDSLRERAKILALTIMRLNQGALLN